MRLLQSWLSVIAIFDSCNDFIDHATNFEPDILDFFFDFLALHLNLLLNLGLEEPVLHELSLLAVLDDRLQLANFAANHLLGNSRLALNDAGESLESTSPLVSFLVILILSRL